MAFDVYDLNELQVELGFLAADIGKSFNNGKFLRLLPEDIKRAPGRNGKELLREGARTKMVRKTKSGAYAMVARQVQQIVSVYEKPASFAGKDGPVPIHNDDHIDVYSQFEALSSESYDSTEVKKEQPVLTYLGAGVSIIGLIISSLISSVGLVGMFTVFLTVVGFLMCLVGTIQFFRFSTSATPKNSKISHLVLTGISLIAVIMTWLATFVMAPQLTPAPNQEFINPPVEDVSSLNSDDNIVEATSKVSDMSHEELRETISFEYGQFTVSKNDSGILSTSLPILLTNTSDQPWVYNIAVRAYNMNGEETGHTDYMYMVRLHPGETVEASMFELMVEDDANLLSQEGITFDIVEIENI